MGGGTFTLGGASVGATSTIELDLGNEITLIPTGTTAQGFTTGLIAGRKVVGSMDSQSRLVATEDVHGEWLSGTEQGDGSRSCRRERHDHFQCSQGAAKQRSKRQTETAKRSTT